jgi:hypothetical protein
MAIVVLVGVCAGGAGCSSSSQARVGSGADALKRRHRSVAEKLADFAKQGWTVTSKELDKKNHAKAIAGTNGMILNQNPYTSNKANPLNNAVWSTNFKVNGQAEKMSGITVVKTGAGGVNVVNGNGGGNGVNMTGPAGMSAKGHVPGKGKGGLEVKGPAGMGSASLGTNNGSPTMGTVNVMGPDGKVHTVRRDLGQDADRLLGPVLSR